MPSGRCAPFSPLQVVKVKSALVKCFAGALHPLLLAEGRSVRALFSVGCLAKLPLPRLLKLGRHLHCCTAHVFWLSAQHPAQLERAPLRVAGQGGAPRRGGAHARDPVRPAALRGDPRAGQPHNCSCGGILRACHGGPRAACGGAGARRAGAAHDARGPSAGWRSWPERPVGARRAGIAQYIREIYHT